MYFLQFLSNQTPSSGNSRASSLRNGTASNTFLRRSHSVTEAPLPSMTSTKHPPPTASTTPLSYPANAVLVSSSQRAPAPSPLAALSPAQIGVSACSHIVRDRHSPHTNRQTAANQQEHASQRRIRRRNNVAEIPSFRKVDSLLEPADVRCAFVAHVVLAPVAEVGKNADLTRDCAKGRIISDGGMGFLSRLIVGMGPEYANFAGWLFTKKPGV
jgi:hypothetical protein